MSSESGPQSLSKVLNDLFALKGYARIQGNELLHKHWKEIAGEPLASQTRVLGIKRGVLQIGVSNAPLLSELVAFRLPQLLKQLQEEASELKVRDLKFILRGDITKPPAAEDDLPDFLRGEPDR
ncbi:hypothetical protein Pla110_00030 [Polystyrenella longa]|uniref:DUF721 domain-containing protein n=1 Tax=Polystyrenella longa TaxID=2528007 RepID=A0A518CGE6_9PLAN|nr:DUF721 domain-containing protein [Polystyrenella longa]QDU78302.1 hypothetical protein Pla110_00030 [Polystyrenella longa]